MLSLCKLGKTPLIDKSPSCEVSQLILDTYSSAMNHPHSFFFFFCYYAVCVDLFVAVWLRLVFDDVFVDMLSAAYLFIQWTFCRSILRSRLSIIASKIGMRGCVTVDLACSFRVKSPNKSTQMMLMRSASRYSKTDTRKGRQ